MNKKSIAALLASVMVLSAPAVAAPIQYTFSTGPTFPSSGVGAGVGLVPLGTIATGSFTYDSSAPQLLPGPAGVGSWYSGAITDFSISIGSFTASDSFGYARVVDSALDTFFSDGSPAGVDRDFFQLYLGPTGGSWTTTPLGTGSVARIRLAWLQSAIGPDFISGESLLLDLPSFLGSLILDIGPLTNPADPLSAASGAVGFGLLKVTKVAVPEPEVALLFLLGLVAVGVSRRRAV